MWAGLQHPHILPLHGFCLSDALDRAWLLSPLATLGDINKYVTATQADQLRRLQLVRPLSDTLALVPDTDILILFQRSSSLRKLSAICTP